MRESKVALLKGPMYRESANSLCTILAKSEARSFKDEWLGGVKVWVREGTPRMKPREKEERIVG